MSRYIFLFSSIIFFCCSSRESENLSEKSVLLFSRLAADSTGIGFSNNLSTTSEFNVFRYRNFYNGGGVAIGDVNNDGLPDVYLTSNMESNKLYLNKGNFKFEDITEKAYVGGRKIWSTGVSMADVNADGWLDIYLCNSGDIRGDNRENELFINNKNGTFTESAALYGLDDKGFSTHSVFFDFDRDGDLDCYVLNNSFRPVSSLGFKNLRDERDIYGGDKLFENRAGRFVDISERAGIFGSVIGFGLGITVGDVNQDNWPDLYISNDFYERDYLYINNQDGTFSEGLEKRMDHLSMFSMGADLADINNDGYPDLFSTDMLPEDDSRLKRMSSFESYDVYQVRLKNGYYHQFMRNMLQLNTKDGSFVEIGEMAGVARTDWSWGALIADFDNDTYKDIFVCNGIYKDVTEQDFVEFLGSSHQLQNAIEGKEVDFQKFVERMSSEKLSNYMFTRESNLKFKNVAKEWGLDELSFSNGAAYGDLDGDGDLDLVVNNVNQEAFVYRNNSEKQKGNNFLAFNFKGYSGNSFGLGASVKVFVDGHVLAVDNMPIRGFQSSMDYKMIIGTGRHSSFDSVLVTWPDDKVQVFNDIKPNTTRLLKYEDAYKSNAAQKEKPEGPLFQEIKNQSIVHQENDFNDFDRDRLLYFMLSTQGPAFAKADLNGDGRDDVFLGGGAGFEGKVLIQRKFATFDELRVDDFREDASSEDVEAEFFDADGDLDMDLYVASGGSEYLTQSSNVLDRLYINTGSTQSPKFEKSDGKLPSLYNSGSCVKVCDFDNDGDLDLFVGTRHIPSYYGLSADQILLLNDGRGNFTNITSEIAPELKKVGMVSDAAWFDYDKNGFKDLMVVGEWLPITIFHNDGKSFKRASVPDFEFTNGWWNSIKTEDLDKDGDLDFVLGNLGLNSKFKPSKNSPVSLYVNDFDQNGSIEPVFAYEISGKEFPMILRQDFVKQMNSFKKQFIHYKDYAQKSMEDIFGSELLDKSTKLNFYEPRTSIVVNNGGGKFTLQALPLEAQMSPVFAAEVADVNADGELDLILGGNLFRVKPEVGRLDALHGVVLLKAKDGSYKALSSPESGLSVRGEVREIAILQSKGKSVFTFVLNNDSLRFFEIQP
jgi:enediyne biosynthesis protein E4